MGNVWKENQKKILSVCAAGIGVYVGFRYLFPLISPFLLALCIVCLLNPWLNRMQKRTRIKKEILLAVLLVLAAAFALGLLAALLQYAAGQAGALVENCHNLFRTGRGIFNLCAQSADIDRQGAAVNIILVTIPQSA